MAPHRESTLRSNILQITSTLLFFTALEAAKLSVSIADCGLTRSAGSATHAVARGFPYRLTDMDVLFRNAIQSRFQGKDPVMEYVPAGCTYITASNEQSVIGRFTVYPNPVDVAKFGDRGLRSFFCCKDESTTMNRCPLDKSLPSVNNLTIPMAILSVEAPAYK
eukprot:2118031-Pleurochrysis_carterae.AAC.1